MSRKSVAAPDGYNAPTMASVLLALQRAFSDLFTPRMFGLVFWPMAIALIFWGAMAYWFGGQWRDGIGLFLATTPAQALLQWSGAEWVLAYVSLIVVVLLWLPAVYLTTVLIAAVVLMPIIVGQVARQYPLLERHKGGTFFGSLANAALATGLYIIAWLFLLPFWLFAPLGLAISIALNAWLNQRLFLYDALAEHADRTELATLTRAEPGARYLLGALLGALHFVPLLNLLAPVFMGLAFSHFGLLGLARHRQEIPA